MKTSEVLFPELAQSDDFNSIQELYRTATHYLIQQGIVQWDDDYPAASTLENNICQQATWIIRIQNEIRATVTLDDEQDPQYLKINWAYASDRVLVVHRLCVHPEYQNQGLAKQLMIFAEQYAVRNGYEVIRLDAFLGNPYSQKLYPRMGFREAAGYCYYPPDEIMCNCFEKWVGW